MAAEIITEPLLDIILDLLLALSCSCKEDSCSSSLSTLDAFRMVMGDGCRKRSHLLCLLEGTKLPTHCRCSHGSSVAPRIIWHSLAGNLSGLVIHKSLRTEKPLREAAAVATHRTREGCSILDHDILKCLMSVPIVRQQPLGHCHGHDGIISIGTQLGKERKVRSLGVVELIHRADHISDYRS